MAASSRVAFWCRSRFVDSDFGGAFCFVAGGGAFVGIHPAASTIGAEIIGYFAPETTVWRGAGLAVAAIAIWLAGFDVYKKGLTALLRGRLNINALMTVAVTGAFDPGRGYTSPSGLKH